MITPSQNLVGGVIKRNVDNNDYYYEVTAVTSKGSVVVILIAYVLEDVLYRPCLAMEKLEDPYLFDYVSMEELGALSVHFPRLSNSSHVSHT